MAAKLPLAGMARELFYDAKLPDFVGVTNKMSV
jgi:hypothetical protein